MVIDKRAAAPDMSVRIHSCGYPLLPDMTVCPHCQQPVDGPAQAGEISPGTVSKRTEVINVKTPAPLEVYQVGHPNASPSPKETTVIRKPDLYDAPQPQAPTTQPAQPVEEVPDKRTINPYVKRKIAKTSSQLPVHCSLQPISRSDEPSESLVKKEYDTTTVKLNRQNTEPGNPSITSRQQAELTFENGQWYIQDKSTLQTTFVQAGRRTAIQDGDIVLLGDREFIFSTK